MQAECVRVMAMPDVDLSGFNAGMDSAARDILRAGQRVAGEANRGSFAAMVANLSARQQSAEAAMCAVLAWEDPPAEQKRDAREFLPRAFAAAKSVQEWCRCGPPDALRPEERRLR